jgi:hypothetical protein
MVRSIPLVLIVLLGCGTGGKANRVVVYGTVSVDGEQVPKGRVRFTPIAGTTGPASVAVIRNGAYRYDYEGGLPVGAHRVQIWGHPADAPDSPGPGGPPIEQLVPGKYNTDSDLRAVFEPSSTPVEYNFDLES